MVRIAARHNSVVGARYGETAVVVLSAFGMILSDCFQFFGSWIVLLKYVALAVMVCYLLSTGARERFDPVRIAFAVAGVAILVLEVVFQEPDCSSLRSIGLFCLVGFFAVLGSRAFGSYEIVYRCGLCCTLLIGILLLLSYSECVRQMTFYLSTGRLRLKGCFSNANSLGHIAAVVSFMAIAARIRFASSKREKRLSEVSLLLCLGYVLLSGSRTALACVVSFLAVASYFSVEERFKTRNARILGRLVVVVVVLGVLAISFQSVLDGYLLSGRIIGWTGIGTKESFTGYGYVSSAGAAELVSIAGGPIEMLWMSVYYRVGIIGILAYALIFAASIYGKGNKGYLLFALLVALFVQAIGESYLTSVMSFPSLFDWLLLGSFSYLESLEESSQRGNG